MMKNRTIFIFLDGVGIGNDVDSNPFYISNAEYLPFYHSGCKLPDGTPVPGIDACLGIDGMPMSATGQTTLFTGTNVPKLLKEHKDSYPCYQMRKVIKQNNLFAALRKKHFQPRFLNAFPGSSHIYTPEHIRIREDGEFQFSQQFRSKVRRSLSVTTCMMIANYMSPFGELDIRKENALFHDYTNQSIHTRGHSLPHFSPEKAGEIIFNTSRKYDLLLYEFFQTDFYGHGFGIPDCVNLIRDLNRMLKQLISMMDKEQDTLVITSDHGNIEDGSTQMHTLNPVPLLAWGKHGDTLRENINSLADVTPAIVNVMER